MWTAAGIAHVVPAYPHQGGRFLKFTLSGTLEAINKGARSRYYPIEMPEIPEETLPVPGRYAIVGIPCFAKAVHVMRHQHHLLQERILVVAVPLLPG